MAVQTRLAPSQLADLAVIRELGEERLEAVAEAMDRDGRNTLATNELGRLFDKALGGERAGSNSLLTQALSLASLMRQRRFTADEVVEGLAYGLRSAPRPWGDEEIGRWERMAPRFQRIFTHPKVKLAAKTLDLSYDFANLLQDARIVSDVRPVFDDAAQTVEAAVVAFTLRLRYDSADRNHSLSIAMNEDDVSSLRDECDRSLRKAEVVRRMMEEGRPLRTIVSGRPEEVD